MGRATSSVKITPRALPKSEGPIAAMPLRVDRPKLKPWWPLDRLRMKIWDDVQTTFKGTDHIRESDKALLHTYVDSVVNYQRMHDLVEELQRDGAPSTMRLRVMRSLDNQARLVNSLGRELALGPLARRHFGTFIEPDKIDHSIERFTVASAGRKS